ncbi:hypothetical protein Q3G72_001474 [Acer saccharum]|nr:hypothetical protein Q3G72_001474 [Acer saccharum]
MAAVDPPRRDGGELLLNESVYAYIAAYTVLPLGQRNPDFKLKRSISLIICFGTTTLGLVSVKNTWARYGKGSRPDTPSPEIDGSYSFRNNVSNTSFEVKENSTGSDSNAVVKCASHAPHSVPSQHGKQSLTQISRTGNESPVSRAENQEVFANTTSSMSSDQNNGLQNISSYENSQTDMGRSSRSDSLRNEEHDRNLDGRPHSNSELMDVSAEVPSRQRISNCSHFGIALPPAVLYGQYPNLGYGYSGIALPPVVTSYQHDPNLVYGYPADPNLSFIGNSSSCSQHR